MNGVHVMLALACAIAALTPAHSRGEGPDVRLARTLGSKNEAVRLQAIAALQADPERTLAVLSQLISVAKTEAEDTSPKELVRPSLVELLNLIGAARRPESEQMLIELLATPHSGIAMVAADTLGKNKLTGGIKTLRRQIYRPEYQMNYGFRFNLIRALAQMKHPDAIEFLDQLRPQLDGQLRFEVDKMIDTVTEFDFQGDAERFAKWRQSRESKVVLVSGETESQARERMALGRAQQYYGIDIRAKRMMFIIDHSGSMREPDTGVSRLFRAKAELIRAITHLPDDAEFGILFYATQVNRWRSELMVATPENKREAIAFVERLGFGNQTNTYAALRQSLEFDSTLEAVFLLTDGRPTTGDIVAPEAIIADIVHRNRFRHLHFNTIGIAVDGPTERFLKTLAESSGGEFCRPH
ncbi:MAG: VWA domain-containing protein [Planctomycetaceae bacterium]